MALVAVVLRREQLADFFKQGTNWGKVVLGLPPTAKLVGIDLQEHITFYYYVHGNSGALTVGKVVWESERSVSVETSQLDPKAPIPERRR